MIDAQLRRIVPKAAGTYFIVRDNRQVAELEAESKMRLIFINTEFGPTNVAVSFAKGDKTGFTNIFGKSTRKMRKAGNFSVETCLDALSGGPITVINLRKFDNTKQIGTVGFTTNAQSVVSGIKEAKIPYTAAFNTNTFWTPRYNAISEQHENCILSFANVGGTPVSLFVVQSDNSYKSLTFEGELSLKATSIEIEDFPALKDLSIKMKDTFVDVYLFNTRFDETSNTNKYYGHLFDENTKLDKSRIQELIEIPEAGFVRRFSGSLLPNIKSETGEEISINTVINQYFMETGLICDINEEVFELSGTELIDVFGASLYKENGDPVENAPKHYLSHVLMERLPELTAGNTKAVPTANNDLVPAVESVRTKFFVERTEDLKREFNGAYVYGLREGDILKGANSTQPVVSIIGVEFIQDDAGKNLGENFLGYQRVKYITDGDIDFGSTPDTPYVIRLRNLAATEIIQPTILSCTTIDDTQIVGRRGKITDILDQMLQPGIVRGLIGMGNIRYVIDAFKSELIAAYKSQYTQLCKTLDESNRFCRSILNDLFIEDLMESTNPLFRDAPNGKFSLEFLLDGGNKVWSSKKVSKPVDGGEFGFFFGPGERDGQVLLGIAGKVSNLFYAKENAWDVVANTSGIVDGIGELEYPFDDNERMYLERFSYNPVISRNGQNKIYQNMTAYHKRGSSFKQIHNSELLAYIKEQLYNLADVEAFKKGNYDDYLRLETQCKEFMLSLVQGGAIEPGYVVVCNESNNTQEIRQQKIKLVHIEYTPVDCLDKVVFDLSVN